MISDNKTRRPQARMQEILDAGLALAEEKGFNKVTRTDVATRAGMGVGTINFHFGNMDQLQRKIMREAVNRGALRVLAQGLAVNHTEALKAPDKMRERAADLIRG
jgi:AcrR family transcriptional regulator